MYKLIDPDFTIYRKRKWQDIVSFCERNGPIVMIFTSYLFLTFVVVYVSVSQYTAFHGPDNGLLCGGVSGLILSFFFTALWTSTKNSMTCLIFITFVISILAGMYLLYGISPFDVESTSSEALSPSVSTFVLSVNSVSGNCRRSYITSFLHMNNIPFTFIDAIDVSEITTFEQAFPAANLSLPIQKSKYHFNRNAAMTVSMMKAMKEGNEQANTHWILVFEDDARFSKSFQHHVNRAIVDHHDKDMIWLDVRSYGGFMLTGSIPCCITGILYKKSSILTMLSYLDFDSDFFNRMNGVNNMIPPNDILLSQLCNKGYFKCTAIPLVSEANFPSTH